MRLSLHKGGIRPDYHGDKGIHTCTYSFYPHADGFSANSVIRPAYLLNYPAYLVQGELYMDAICKVDADNVFVEAIKPCEDTQHAFILRLYEAEGTYTNTGIRFCDGVKQIIETNMLEEDIEDYGKDLQELVFKPFEIKTIKVLY